MTETNQPEGEPTEDSTRSEIDAYAASEGVDTTGAANKQAALDMIDRNSRGEAEPVEEDPLSGTVGEYDPDQSLPNSMRVALYNERPADTETIRVNGQDVENPQATFRAATGHNYDVAS